MDYEKLSSNKVGETSELIRQRVQFATDIVSNTDMLIGEVRQFSQLQPEGQSLKRAVMSQLNLSARAYHRILKLSRTIADLAGSEEKQSKHLAETWHYRPKIMMG